MNLFHSFYVYRHEKSITELYLQIFFNSMIYKKPLYFIIFIYYFMNNILEKPPLINQELEIKFRTEIVNLM